MAAVTGEVVDAGGSGEIVIRANNADELRGLMARAAVDRAPVPLKNGHLAPVDMDGIARLAGAFCRAGIGPQVGAYGSRRKLNEAEMFSVLAFGMAAGLNPTQALSNVYLINDRPALFGDAIPALLMASGQVLYRDGYENENGDEKDLVAWAEVIRLRNGEPIKLPDGSLFSIRRTFSWRDAMKAQLLAKSGPWKEHTKRMLLLRARAFAARDGAADILGGLAVAEEVQDTPVSTPAVTSEERKGSIEAARAALDAAKPAAVTEPLLQAGGPGRSVADAQPNPPSAGEDFAREMGEKMVGKKADMVVLDDHDTPVAAGGPESVKKWREARRKAGGK